MSKKRKGNKGIFRPGYSPSQLWNLPVRKRKVDASGVLSPEDTIVAVARGMHPGVLRKAEEKAMLDGGILVLRKAGLPIPSRPTFERVKREVSRHGAALEKAAWGARGVLLLGGTGMKVSSAVHAAVPVVASLFGPIGLLVAAAAGGHVAISQGIARKVMAEQEGYLKAGLREYGGKARENVSPPTMEEETAMVEASPRFPWLLAVAGLAAIGLGFFALSEDT